MRFHLPLLLFASWITGGKETIPPPTEPVVALDVSKLLPPGPAEHISATVTFVSDTSIAVGACSGYTPRTCSLSLVRWKDGRLETVAGTQDFGPTVANLHHAPGGKILATSVPGSATLYSADLSSKRSLQPVSMVSFSGRTVGEWVQGGWKIRQIDLPEPIGSGRGSLRSVSDDVVVFQSGDVMYTVTVKGEPVASFAVPPESKCATLARVLPGGRIYLEGCKEDRIVDFGGDTKLRVRRPKGWSSNSSELDRFSADGNRLLFNSWSRKVSFFRSAGEIAVAFATFGMGVGEEEGNREEIRVIDTTSGHICFERRRSFRMGSESVFYTTAAMSPSGEFVAIAANGVLSVYHLPSICESKT
jgi:hypothetical protein